MPIQRLNHAVLYVSDLDRSLAFYTEILGFRVKEQVDGAAFLQAEGSSNDHDLGLFASPTPLGPSTAGRSTVGLYHLAWEVDTLGSLQEVEGRLRSADALVGASDHATTKALYGHDPDGLEFEVSWFLPPELLTPDVLARGVTIAPLDLPAEVERYGAETLGFSASALAR
ncbi:VOC family protein [Naumannella halotolerans]|uniref:Glyoxalase/bleomycin resistance protein/dioxygenase superfamily protein n=1 Tax=Naumannella halotolerans TaxID=993414 RepID=A0A4V3ENL8_9ACTN|nr:VOC family protein [Naumannella halotolerans]TDT34258.1 glyoxalase/bleomycin resistance protein/dioxygenase superfamily protein [Naumannella halotolerans]